MRQRLSSGLTLAGFPLRSGKRRASAAADDTVRTLMALVAEHRRLEDLRPWAPGATGEVVAHADLASALERVEERFEQILREQVDHGLVRDAWWSYLRGHGPMPDVPAVRP